MKMKEAFNIDMSKIDYNNHEEVKALIQYLINIVQGTNKNKDLLEDALKIDMSKIDYNDHKEVKTIIDHLTNIVEGLYQENNELKDENEKLRDEINRLKGEQGEIKRNVGKGKEDKDKEDKDKDKDKEEEDKEDKENRDKDKDKDKEEKKKGNRGQKGEKIGKVNVDKIERVKYDGDLPIDAEYKGTRSVIVQDIEIRSNNIEYQVERYYSPSEKKIYEASLPEGVKGPFGASLKSWIIFWYFHSRIPQKKIHQMLTDIGIIISEGEVSNILTKNNEEFHKEKEEIVKAGIESTSYQHIDDTEAKVNGEKQHFVVICNEYFSAFFTTPRKDRLSMLEVLSQEGELSFLINDYALTFLGEIGVSKNIIKCISTLEYKGAMKRENLEHDLELWNQE